MKKTKLILMVLIISAFENSCYRHAGRNILSFKNRLYDVQDSLIRMQQILSKLPKRIDNRNRNYLLQRDSLFLNGIPIEKFSELNKSSTIYTKKEIEEIFSITNYLNNNSVSSAYFDDVNELWRFIYKSVPNNDYNSVRDICLSYNSKSFITSDDTVLDHKAQLYLLAPKDAVIR